MTDAAELRRRTQELLAAHPPATTERADFLRARFDAGLAWVHFPEGFGGLGFALGDGSAFAAAFGEGFARGLGFGGSGTPSEPRLSTLRR